MRAITLLLIVVLTFLPSGQLAAAPDLTLFGRVARFTQPLYKDAASTDIICTAFLVEHRLVSAAHCFDIDVDEGDLVGETRYLHGGQPVQALTVIHDFAILGRYSTFWVPTRGLELAEYQPPPGAPVWAFGYAWGMPEIGMAAGYVFGYPAETPYFGGLPCQRFTLNVIGGMSGGPVVDAEGKVISQNMFLRTWHSSGIAFGLPLSVFQAALRH